MNPQQYSKQNLRIYINKELKEFKKLDKPTKKVKKALSVIIKRRDKPINLSKKNMRRAGKVNERIA
jgi:16S rRNA C1402 N4-methylase RsmH